MLKTTIVAICLFTSTILVHGQSYLGFKAGMNVSNLTSTQSNAKLGFLGGVTFDTPISDDLSFYPGLLFTFNRYNSSIKFREFNYALQSYALEVPVLLSYKIGEYPTQFGLDFGPYFRYCLFGKTKINNIEHNTFDDIKRFDFGGQVGLRFLMNEIQVGFNLQYGLIKPCDLYKGNNYTFNLMLGYNFEL